ncbi:MAG: peptidylprolyl isomerase [Nitrospinota bacterium]|nr:peptidylprolyl isomerase [Nitrospinota bacterium]
MKPLIDLKLLFLLLISFCVTTGTAAGVWAHGGHDHSVEPTISLPEVLAKVNETDIHKSEIWSDLTNTVKRYKDRGIPLTREQEKVAAKKLLQDQINRHLLLAKADKMGIQVSPGKVDEELNKVKERFSSEQEFMEQLKDKNLTLEQYRQDLQEDILIDAVFRRELGDGIKVSDQEVEDYFKNNPQQFSIGEQRRASVILLKVDPKAGSAGDQQARQDLQKILDKLNKGGDFAELARLHSQDSLAKKGGDLGFFTQDRMFGPFSKLAFKLNVGQVSEIFRTKHGYQILKVTGKKEAKKETLENEKENIRKLLIDQQIKSKSHPYLEALRKQAKIKIYF